MDPLLSLCLVGLRRQYSAGDELVCEYQFDAVAADEIQSVEASILWFSEGKGDEDLGVHYFERRLPADADEGDLRPLRRLRVTLPNSPLTYRGAILNIQWCIRVRLFLRSGKDYLQELPFTLGSVPIAPVTAPALS